MQVTPGICAKEPSVDLKGGRARSATCSCRPLGSRSNFKEILWLRSPYLCNMGTKAGKKRANVDTQGEDKAGQSPDKRSKQEEQRKPKQTEYEMFMEQIEKREKQLDKVCLVLEQPDLDEDDEGECVEPTLAQLQPLRRIYVPKKMNDYSEQVGYKHAPTADPCSK